MSKRAARARGSTEPAEWETPRVTVSNAKSADLSEGLNPEGKVGHS